ncbi:MAG: transketolase [Tannerella sp.]|jgi:transketolase|nr:transketolase [Tannerella sp.]
MNHLTKLKGLCLKTLLPMYKTANAGHIAASLSCLDILIYLFSVKMTKDDMFILSKGHAAVALYTVLAKSGRIPEEMLDTFYKDGTSLAAHPPCNGLIKDIPFGTGSLGHGLSLATGLTFAQKYTAKQCKIYCVLSDGDCNEGSTWEAALFAAQHKLQNLTVIVDYNKLQGFGYSQEIINLESLAEKFKSFGFETVFAENGNDFNSLHTAFEQLSLTTSGQPKCIVARTTKGAGISFMENKLEWHYLPMTDKEYQQALAEIHA